MGAEGKLVGCQSPVFCSCAGVPPEDTAYGAKGAELVVHGSHERPWWLKDQQLYLLQTECGKSNSPFRRQTQGQANSSCCSLRLFPAPLWPL